MTNYVATLVHLVADPKIVYAGVNPDYLEIDWQDERQQPSREECDEVWPSLEIMLANEASRRARADAYREEADPLFFGWKRGETTEQAWLDKVEEIRNRYAYLT